MEDILLCAALVGVFLFGFYFIDRILSSPDGRGRDRRRSSGQR